MIGQVRAKRSEGAALRAAAAGEASYPMRLSEAAPSDPNSLAPPGAAVMRYDGATGAPLPSGVNPGSRFSTGGALSGPLDLVFGSDGNLYVASFFTDNVQRFDGTTGTFIDAFVTTGSGGLDGPFFLTFTPPPTQVPGPGTLALVGSGLAGLAALAWRRR